jgi:ubiquinone/menaquinone biosynthesis C-methylase UbiE
MGSEYWKEHWNHSATENSDLIMISGWGNRSFQDMLITINDITKKLDLKSVDRLLDIGCGAGLFEIAFSPWISEIYGVDFSEKMVKLARQNCMNFENVKIVNAEIAKLPFPDGFFSKVLLNSMIQYLPDTKEVKRGLKEVERVTADGGRVLLSFVPDNSQKEQFLNGFYSLGLSDDEARKKIDANKKSIWFERERMIELLQNIGFSKVEIQKPINPFHSSYCFDLLITKN